MSADLAYGPSIAASQIASPPEWARLQRRLLEVGEQNAALMVEKHCAPGGMMYYVDDIDDYYEKVDNWSVFYAMGGARKVFDDAMMIWNASTRTNGPRGNPVFGWMLPQLYNEYYCLGRQEASTWVPGRRMVNEWHHHSEGNMAFYGFGLADPEIPENVDRARRFADMFIGADPEAPNWDARHRIIRSPFPTSRGPVFEVTLENAMAELHGSRVHVAGEDYLFKEMGTKTTLRPRLDSLEDGWWKKPARAAEVLKLFNHMVLDGDVANNLAACSLVTNAYLYTGEERYKKWVLDYVEAWMDRIRKNGGIIPDNVGPNGIIGEHRDGQWWGGLMGWSYYMGFNIIFHGLISAAECAQLLTGDAGYLDILRSQLKVVADNAVTGRDGQLLVRYRHDHRGWVDENEYGHLGASPMRGKDLAHLWHASLAPEDYELFRHFRDGEVRRDWNEMLGASEKDQGESELARFNYYDGLNPDWPVRILRHELDDALGRRQRLLSEDRTPQELVDQHAHPVNGIRSRALIQTMLGCPQMVYNGSLLRATVRYFDAHAGRPGLPADTAALVEEIRPDGAAVRLVNLSASGEAAIIVQAGAFGEHAFTEATWREGEETRQRPVEGRFLTVTLPASTSIRLDLGMERFVNTPSYAHPWHDDGIQVASEPEMPPGYPY